MQGVPWHDQGRAGLQHCVAWDSSGWSALAPAPGCSRGHLPRRSRTPPQPTQVHSVGDWWEAPPDSPYMRMAERAVEREWGVQPLLVREGERTPC